MKWFMLVISAFSLVISATAQPPSAAAKTQTEELLRILNDSAWGKTQTDTDTSEMFFSPTRPGAGTPAGTQPIPGAIREQQARNNERTERGAFNQAVSVNYRIRFFSAKPIREALAGLFVLQNPTAPKEIVADWQGFVNRDFGPFIVITVDFDAADGRMLGPAIQAFGSSTKDTLRNKAYLERNDGKRVFLIDYRPPSGDGIGSRFVFPRLLDGKPFLAMSSGFVRFVSEMPRDIKLNMKFDVSKMIYEDRISY